MSLESELKRIKAIRKDMSAIKVGLPTSVHFYYSKGTVICYPKEKRWIIDVIGGKIIQHIIRPTDRNDVTKYKAKHFLKLAILGLLREDKSINSPKPH